jgi:5'-nucleotidase / UDP-sugar diphosphatase
MMKRRYLFSCLALLLVFSSCRKDEHKPEPTALGTVTVKLNANETQVRKKESLIGNLVADAIMADVLSKGKAVDLALINGGSIRYSISKRPDGIYPAGIFTAEMIDEMVPFGDATVIVKMTGKELKSIFERAVAQYPLAKGPFFQVSGEIKISVDTTMPGQVVDISETTIINNGNRIRSVKVNDTDLDSAASYYVALPQFIADGNDGFVTLKNIPAASKENLIEDQANAVKEYIILNTPVTPVLESRIVFE